MRWRRSGEGLGIYGGEGLEGCWIPRPVIRREGEARIGDMAGRRGGWGWFVKRWIGMDRWRAAVRLI
jgi:hypothetical protein